jgi:hypothetical protein
VAPLIDMPVCVLFAALIDVTVLSSSLRSSMCLFVSSSLRSSTFLFVSSSLRSSDALLG